MVRPPINPAAAQMFDGGVPTQAIALGRERPIAVIEAQNSCEPKKRRRRPLDVVGRSNVINLSSWAPTCVAP